MSEAPQGPGWWQATDGRWYPPEQAPQAPPQQTPTYWYGQGVVGGTPPRTDSLAVTAFVFALAGLPVGLVCGLGFFLPVAAIPMGFVSRSRIDKSDGALTGRGFAVAAIIIGIAAVVLMILGIVLILFFIANFGDPGTVD